MSNTYLTFESGSYVQIDLMPAVCTKKEDKKTGNQVKVYKPRSKAKIETLQVCLSSIKDAQQLVLRFKPEENETTLVDVATFTVKADGSINFQASPNYSQHKDRVHIPINTNYDPFESSNLKALFEKWLLGKVFQDHLTAMAASGDYTVALTKMILFFVSYSTVRSEVRIHDGDFGSNLDVPIESVVANYQTRINAAIEKDLGHLAKKYQDLPVLTASKVQEPETTAETPKVEVMLDEPKIEPEKELVEETKIVDALTVEIITEEPEPNTDNSESVETPEEEPVIEVTAVSEPESTAESEVAISFAISIFSNEKFKADDDRLNYQSYEELGLICGKCRELIFFKQGTKRVAHFSHFKDTGKDCPWRTESHSNTQSSDSYKREQSLQKFQTKFRGIIEEGIIKYQQISSSQLREQIKQGQRLVSTYKIDIEYWLRWFNQNRKQLENLAKNLYKSNELVFEYNQIIFLNFVDYLCVPASEYILRDILYYVFGLLDKEISVKKYLEEVCSKVIELMSYAEWEKEYKRAKEGVNSYYSLEIKSTTETEVAATKPTEKLANECLGETENSSSFNTVSLEEVANPIVSDSIAFEGIKHPNLPIKSPKPATITERVEPKPIKIDGSRTNNHELQLRTILGNVPCILTVRKSYQQWQLVALPIKVNPVDLITYLSDKLASKALIAHIGEQVSELVSTLAKNNEDILGLNEKLSSLSSDIQLAPLIRTIENELHQLENSNTSINSIISQLDKLASNINSGIKPDKIDVLAATQSIRSILNDSHIKHESSYSDDYYRYHVLGNLKIVETIETEKPSYSMTVLGDERDTRRSSIPLVMNWLRRVPQILQKHFGEDYPSNSDIKNHLMSVYPFYKRRLKEGDKLDKSYTHSEAEMIIKVKDRVIVEVYFNGEIQTKQLISITKPVNASERQGKIPVKVTSSLGFSLDNLQSFLKCNNDRKNLELLQKVQNNLNAICQKFVANNVRLFTREREDKITQVTSTKDLLGFTGNSPGLPQVLKSFKKFTLPYTSNSEVEIGKLVNLLTLETYDQHDTQALFEAMINNWKVWAITESIEFGGITITRKNPGDLIANIFHKTKGHHAQVIWGEFVDELYLLSNLKIGFRTNEGVLLTPWSLLPTQKQTWQYRIKIQLIDTLYCNQTQKIKEAEYLMKDEKTREEGKALRDKARIGAVESWLQQDIDSIRTKLNTVYPKWRETVHPNVLSHLETLEKSLEIASQI